MTNFSRRGILHAGLLAAAASPLAACSGGNAGPAANGSASRVTPGRGGTLRYGCVGSGPSTNDPHGQLFSEFDWARLSCLYDTVTQRSDKGAAAPALATSWSASPDARQWTFQLRKDAVFSDGSPVTADDVLFSLGRMVSKAKENGGRAGTVDIARSKAIDQHTVLLATTQPDALLPQTLTLGSFVVKKGTKDFTKPVGSGPFVLQRLSQQTAVLTATDHWWGGRPGLDRVELRGFADPQALAQAIRGGSIDMAAGVQPAAAKAAQAAGLQVVTRPGGESTPLLLRVDVKPFDDPRVRKAVKCALDREAMVQQVYLGYGTAGLDVIRLNEPGVPQLPVPTRDVETAKRLLAEAGHAGGLDVVLHTTTQYPAMSTAATVVKQQLAEVGIRVTIKTHAPDQYWSTAYASQPFTVGYYGATADFATLARATVLSSASYSETGWKDKGFDAAFAKAVGTVDETSRNQQLEALHRRMANEGGWVVWGFGDDIVLHQAKVHGVKAEARRHDLTGITVG